MAVISEAPSGASFLELADAAKFRPEDSIKPKQLAKHLRSRRALFTRLDVTFPAKAVKQKIAALARR